MKSNSLLAQPISFLPVSLSENYCDKISSSIAHTFSFSSLDFHNYESVNYQSINFSSQQEKQNLIVTPNFDKHKSVQKEKRKSYQNLKKESKGYIKLHQEDISICVCSILIDDTYLHPNIQFKLKILYIGNKQWFVKRTLNQLSALLQFYSLSFMTLSSNNNQRACIENIIRLLVQKDRVRNTKAFQKFIKLKTVL